VRRDRPKGSPPSWPRGVRERRRVQPDGRRVVSAGPGKASIWALSATDLPFDRLFFFAGHSGPIDAAAFARSGFMLATAGSDSSIRTYTCALCGTTHQLVALAQHRLAGLAGK
jgi:hypothetical protein